MIEDSYGTPSNPAPSPTGARVPVILHIAPSNVDIRPGQGSHKDVSARRRFLAATGHDYHYVNVSGDEPSQLEDVLKRCIPTHVLIEYSYFPRIAKALRSRFGDAYIGVRSHNIEPLQEWSLREAVTPIGHLRDVYAFFRLLIYDIRIARIADSILVIAPAEARRYWRWLGSGGKVSWLPYIPPPDFSSQDGGGDRGMIACLPGGARSRRTVDLVNRFALFAQAAKSAGWTQRFVITGDIGGWDVKLTPAVELAGYVEDLTGFYRSVAAVAILSPIGYGFKTTIADAIWSGAKVVLHPTIGATLPAELAPYCMILDAPTAIELARVHSLLGTPVPDSMARQGLTRRFEQEMQRFMQGHTLNQSAVVDRLQQ